MNSSLNYLDKMINWETQWENFAPNFYEGKAHIDLSPHGTLLLIPGEGFGDCSHSTTRLMLELMKPHVQNRIILDIGCGSGILSLASLFLGAKKAYGVDIDSAAILHAKKNAALNHLDKKAHFSRKYKAPTTDAIVLMNMIFSEQKIAFKSHNAYVFDKLITSGILSDQRDSYLNWTTKVGWKLLDEKSEGNWLGFIFETIHKERTC